MTASNTDVSAVLSLLHPAVRLWFEQRFPHGPTEPQVASWPAILCGRDTLIAAPTGSGKTLAAFLVFISQLLAENAAEDATRVVYVSPLKALTVDIQQNLERPLAEIAELARAAGLNCPEIRVGVRSGDTPSKARAAMIRKPPHILITTPESLYLLVSAERTREMLRTTRAVIVDEIHAIARDKRGVHLAVTLERLEHVCHERPVRVGLSATQRPIERIAELLVGGRFDPARPSCTIVDTGHRRALDLALELPDSELQAVASAEQVAEVLDKIAKHVAERRTTLVFVNTRRQAERFAHLLAERLGENKVAAHHGSLSKERRLRVEERLRAGDLAALVATASLELGIDVGPVELVCQIGSPRSIATFLQRVGRSGHNRFATPVGRIYPLTRDELVECAALLWAVRRGQLDAIHVPEAPLDILAQQIVAECSAEDWSERELYELMRGAAPYRELGPEQFEDALALVCDGVVTGRGARAAYLHRDRIHERVKGRRGARLAAITSGGAIPEMADYRVIAEPDETFVGTINEDFAIESMAGDVFLLGSTAWRIRRVEQGVVRVVDAAGAAPTVPFWLGEAPSRTSELSHAVSELREEIASALNLAADSARVWLEREIGLNAAAAAELCAYVSAGRDALGLVPTARDLVVERFFDDTGGMQLVVHSPYGGRINRALGLLLRKRFCTSFDFELQAAASDDAVVLSLGPQHSFPLDDMRGFFRTERVREALTHAVIVTPMFATRWRHNLNRALIVLRYKGGRKNPAQLQRMEADDVMVAVFPALAACQDNAQGPREIPDHPLVRQTLDDCFREAMDVAGLEELLRAIADGRVRVHVRDTTEPSLFAHEILNSRPYTFLDDAPLEERRTRAVQLRRGVPLETRSLVQLDAEAIARVRQQVAPDPRDADELHDLILSVAVLPPNQAWQALYDDLEQSGRAATLLVGERHFWTARQQRRLTDALFPGARYVPEGKAPAAVIGPAQEPEQCAEHVLRGHLEILGPSTTAQLCELTQLDSTVVEVTLSRLELSGFALRGYFEAAAEQEAQWCSRRLLSRIHSYTRARLRREIEPVSAQDFMRFLLRWQRVEPGTQVSGARGLLSVVEALQGFEVAAAAWEAHVLPARIAGYSAETLDRLCLSGQVSWARLTLNAPRAELTRATQLSRATPVSLAIRADLGWLIHCARGSSAAYEPVLDDSARVLSCLRRAGASFVAELCRSCDLTRAQVEAALWDLVARGSIHADGFQALRALLSPLGRRHEPESPARVRLRQGATSLFSAEGRWSRLPEFEPPEPDSLVEALAEQLLARWGVVFRDLYVHERLAVPWRELVFALRRLEARGTIRGGRFVSGFSGEQYALPDAIDLLRTVRKAEPSGVTVTLNACDPLNLVGVILPGPRIPAVRTNSLMLRDGALVSAGVSEQAVANAET